MSNSNHTLKAMFNSWYLKQKDTIKYRLEWSDEQHFKNVVDGEHAPVLGCGVIVTCKDPYGRRMVIMGTLLGNIVVYEKQTSGTIISMNAHNKVMSSHLGLIFKGAQSSDGLRFITGTNEYYPNIAQRIRFIAENTKPTI